MVRILVACTHPAHWAVLGGSTFGNARVLAQDCASLLLLQVLLLFLASSACLVGTSITSISCARTRSALLPCGGWGVSATNRPDLSEQGFHFCFETCHSHRLSQWGEHLVRPQLSWLNPAKGEACCHACLPCEKRLLLSL